MTSFCRVSDAFVVFLHSSGWEKEKSLLLWFAKAQNLFVIGVQLNIFFQTLRGKRCDEVLKRIMG